MRLISASGILLIPMAFILISSCGRHVDDPSLIKEGYEFVHDTMISHKVVTWWNTYEIEHHYSDYVHGDTLFDYGLVELIDTAKIPIPLIPPPSANKDIDMTIAKVLKVGFGTLDGEIRIFPSWFHLEQISGPYYSATFYANGSKYGLIHASGYMVSDVEYTHFVLDSAAREIDCMMGDSLVKSYPINP